MDPRVKLHLIILFILLVTVTLAFVWSETCVTTIVPENELPALFSMRAVITSVSLVSSSMLSIMYGKLLIRKPSGFSASLLLVSGAMFFSALISNPFIGWVFGWQMFGFGGIVIGSSIFNFIATITLLHISLE